MYQPPRKQPVIQPWVSTLSLMQQTVLLTAVRGPDGLPKYHPAKYLLRWYRRCLLYSAMDHKILLNPWDKGGGSFTGPSLIPNANIPLITGQKISSITGAVWDRSNWQAGMTYWVTEYLRSVDQVPLHFHLHLMHAIEIMGYKYPSNSELDYPGNGPSVRGWWHQVYQRLVHDMHLWPESEPEMDRRLADDREGWLARGDVATND